MTTEEQDESSTLGEAESEARRYLVRVEEELERRERKLTLLRQEVSEVEAELLKLTRVGWGVLSRGFEVEVVESRRKQLRRLLEKMQPQLTEADREVQMARERRAVVLTELNGESAE